MFSLLISRRYRLRGEWLNSPSLLRLLGSQNGLRCDFPEAPIEIVTSSGGTKTLTFFYDTGSDHMVIPVYIARHHGIQYRQDFPGVISSSVGGRARCYYDFGQVRSSLSGRTHRWVCAFVESVQARLIVGRAGFLDDFAAAIRGHHLVVSCPVSLGRFLKHHAGRLRARAGDEAEPI
jgi:hypothetical protein